MTKSVGVIGLGDMGLAMARNLLAAGFPTSGYDLREERLALLEEAGGSRAASPAKLARDVEVVFVMVLNGAQAQQVVSGENGLLGALPPGATLIITATIEPCELRAISQRAGRQRHPPDRLPGQRWAVRRAGRYPHPNGRRAGRNTRRAA